MAGPNPNLQGKSFIWAFVVFVTLFSASAFWGKSFGFNHEWAALLLALAGFIPFLIQASTGYALDAMWVARFRRTEHPTRYWLMLLLSLAVAVWFSYVAYSMYAGALRVAA